MSEEEGAKVQSTSKVEREEGSKKGKNNDEAQCVSIPPYAC